MRPHTRAKQAKLSEKKFFSDTAVLNFEKFLESIVNAVFGKQANRQTLQKGLPFLQKFIIKVFYMTMPLCFQAKTHSAVNR